MKDYQYILFDLDGTITESGPGIMNSVEYALNRLGIDVGDRDGLRRFIGPPLVDSMMQFYGTSREEAERGVVYYREYYAEKGIFENTVYNGVEEMLGQLKRAGRTVALATSKPENYARRILEHFGLMSYFDAVCGATMDSSRIKKGDVIRYTLQTLQVPETEKSRVLMVGDREHDVQGAAQNSLDVLGVLYGYGTEEELKKAGVTYLAHTPRETACMILGGQGNE